MTYDKFLEEVNKLTSEYEKDRQELSDKYQSDTQKISDKFEKDKSKAFDEYKKYQTALDEANSDGIVDKKEKKILNKLSK